MKLLPIAAWIALLAGNPLCGQDLPQWVLQLSKVKRQAKAQLVRLPDFACVETIKRFERRPNSEPSKALDGFKALDTIHLDVAFVGGKELVAPPGAAGSFQEMDMRSLAFGGAIGTGAFSAVARNLFVNDNGRTTGMVEDRTSLERPALRFSFVVPESQAGYTINSGTAVGKAGIEGDFWADAESLELLRIEEHAVDIPAFLEIREAITTVDYAKTRIAGSDVLLPRSAEMLVANWTGWRGRNTIDFSGCREYVAESVIRFDTDPPPAPAKKK